MAKTRRGSKYELDELKFDDGLDIPDFAFDGAKVKDDRKPATKFVRGFAGGIKDTATSPAFIAKTMKGALPKGYGQGMDLIDETAGSLRNLYDNATKEMKPAINDMKRFTARVVPATEKFLPKKIADRLKKWGASTDDQDAQLSAEAAREQGLALQMAEIFGAETERAADQENRQDAKDRLKDGIEHARHRDQLGQLDAIRRGVQQQSAYTTGVMAKVQRKSLELQYRQYFAAKDTLQEMRRFNAVSEQQLAEIKKNTGLPDYVKLQGKEAFSQVMRNKFIGSLADGVFERRRDFIKNLTGNLGRQVMSKVSGFAGGMKDALGMANMGMDMMDSMKGMVSPAEMGGNLAGGAATGFAGGKLAKWLAPKLAKNRKLMKWGNNISYGVQNLPQLLGGWAKSSKGFGAGGGMFDGLIGFAKDLIGSTIGGQDNQVTRDNASNINAPGVITRQAVKSITEIIPGFLARIYRELKIMRTGDESMELSVYDYNKNKFTSDSERAKTNFDSLFGWGRKATNEQVNGFVDKLDKDGKLSPEQKAELGKILLKDNLNQGAMKQSRQGNEQFYGDSQNAKLYAELFNKHLDGDTSGQKRNDLSTAYRNLGSYIGDSRAKIQEHLNAGAGDYLYEAGVVRPDGTIDQDKLRDYHINEDWSPTKGPRKARKGPGGKGFPHFAAGGMHQGGVALTGEKGPELKVHGPARFYNHQQTMQMLKDAGVDNTVKSTLGFMAATLTRIEDQLSSGIIAFNGGEMLGAMGTKMRGFYDRLKKRGRDLGGTIRDFAKEGRERAKDWGAQAKERGKYFAEKAKAKWQEWKPDVKRLGAGLWGHAMDLKTKGQEKLSNAFNWARTTGLDQAKTLGKKWVGDADVFIKGEVAPRLEAIKLRMGHYKDELTGKVIKKYEDIKGNVLDENGKIVLTVEEAKKAFLKNKWGVKALEGLTRLKDGAKALFARLSGGMPAAVRSLKDSAKKAWNFLVNHPQDVYVKGKMDKAALRATVMEAGGYFSKLTGKAIKHPGEIDGTILDGDGKEVLTTEDIQKGLVNQFGQPLRTRLGRIFGVGAALAGKAVRAVLAAGRWAAGKAGSLLGHLPGMGKLGGALGRGFGNLTSGIGNLFGGGDQVDLLTQIRDILDERLPQGGGGNGFWDGASTNDLPDLGGEGKGKPGAPGESAGKPMGANEGPQRPGRMSRWGSKIKGSRAGQWVGRGANALKATRVGGMAGRAAGAIGSVGSKAMGWGGRALGAAGRVGSSVMGAGGSMLGTAGKAVLAGGSKLLGVAGTAYGAYSTYQDLKEGNYGQAAIDGGLTLGGAALTAGGVGAMWGGIATGAAAIGTGLAALAASPVILGALAVAAVAGAGYLGYKYFTRKKLGKLSKLRWAQYGWSEEQTDHLSVVFGLEDKLKKAIKWEDSGPKLELDKVEAKGILEDFGVDPKSAEQMQRFSGWFQNRFKPVFLTHVAAMKAVEPDKWLDSVDDLKGDAAKRYFGLARFDSGPYNYTSSPFKDEKLLDSSGVAGVTTSVGNDLEKEKTDEKSKSTAPAAAAAAVAAKPGAEAAANATANAQGTSAAAGPKNPQQALRLADQGGGASVAATAGFTGFALTGAGKLDALTALRYKTYGLHEMVVEKARALAMLEVEMLRRLKFDGNKVAAFSGSLDKVLETVGPAFGVNGVANDAAYDWKSWFNMRFLPVFLNFATAVAQATSKFDFTPLDVLKQLQGNQAVDVAQAVYTTSGVWSQTASPWPGFVLNTEVRSIEQNFEALKELGKKSVMPEQTGSKDAKGTGKDNGQGVTDGTNGAGKSVMSRAWDSFTGAASSAWQGVKNAVTNAGSAVGTGIYNATHTDPNVSLAGGQKATDLQEGTNDKYGSLPAPKGDGSYAAFQDLFAACAKMVGVDPKLMATMAAVESGFQASIRNPLGSATGLFQFVDKTWTGMMRKYGAKFGIPPGTPSTDPRANALMGALYIRENFQAIKGVKPDVSDTDIYMAHFLGAGGAKTFFKADPNAAIGQVMPDIVSQNPGIVWKDKGRTQMRTVAEVYALMNEKIRSRGAQFGLGGAGTGSLAAAGAGAGRGSVNPEMPGAAPEAQASTAGAGRGSVNPAAAIPVSDAAPAMQATGGPAPSAGSSTTSDSGATYSNAAPAQSAGAAGYTPSRSQDVQVVQQAQRDDLNKSLGTLGDTAQQHLGVSRDMLLVLKSVEKILSDKLGLGGAAQPEASAAQGQPQARQQREMPAPPVSMRKLSTESNW